MLILMINMRPHSAQMRLIAQVLALDMGWPQPGHIPQVPNFLASAVRVLPARRSDDFYATLCFETVPYQAG